MSSPEPATLSGPKKRRERERAAARQAILAAARELGRSEGWDAVTMRALADRLEYSANFAYRYFTGRDDILLALVRGGFAQLHDVMVVAANSETERDAEAGSVEPPEWGAIRRAAHAYLDFALTESDLYQLMYGVGGSRVPATDAWTEGQAIGDVMIGLLQSAGDVEAERHVLQLWATTHGLISLAAVGRVIEDPDALHAIADDAIGDVLGRVAAAGASKTGKGGKR
jgi:AcrR family transcriptional regulator